jgi:hypothetical protein
MDSKPPILVSRHELARLRGQDVRSLRLPPVVARLLAGRNFMPLFAFPIEIINSAMSVNAANAKPALEHS